MSERRRAREEGRGMKDERRRTRDEGRIRNGITFVPRPSSIVHQLTGLTLIEVVLTVSILVIAGMMAAPRIAGSINAQDLDAETKKLRAHLRSIQVKAVSEQSTYEVNFDPFNERYTITKNPLGPNSVVDGPYALASTVDLSSTSFQSNRFQFDFFGSPSQGGSISLIDRNSNNQKTIAVEAGTGMVRVT